MITLKGDKKVDFGEAINSDILVKYLLFLFIKPSGFYYVPYFNDKGGKTLNSQQPKKVCEYLS